MLARSEASTLPKGGEFMTMRSSSARSGPAPTASRPQEPLGLVGVSDDALIGGRQLSSHGTLEPNFPLIADYALLSDCENTCLIAPSGAVEWLCLPRPHDPSVFGTLLDRSAGSFRFGPSGCRRCQRIGDTCRARWCSLPPGRPERDGSPFETSLPSVPGATTLTARRSIGAYREISMPAMRWSG